MFNNIGQKIKKFAKASFVFFAIAEVITGIACLSIDEDLFLILGLPIMLAGPLVSLISAWFLYGFGELIDKVCNIESILRTDNQSKKANPEADTEKKARLESLLSRGIITEEEYNQVISKKQ